jgi:hypothetical protein
MVAEGVSADRIRNLKQIRRAKNTDTGHKTELAFRLAQKISIMRRKLGVNRECRSRFGPQRITLGQSGN